MKDTTRCTMRAPGLKEGVDPLCFLARCRKRWLNQALSLLSLNLILLWVCVCCAVNYSHFLCCVISCYLCVLPLGCSGQVVSTSASDWLERLVSEMTYNVLMRTLNPTQSLTHWTDYHAVNVRHSKCTHSFPLRHTCLHTLAMNTLAAEYACCLSIYC